MLIYELIAHFFPEGLSRVRELIGAIAQSKPVAVDAARMPSSASADNDRPPTKAMVAFATSLAARQGLKLLRGLKGNSAICRAFLDQHAPQRASRPGEGMQQAGPRAPTEAMLRYAHSLAQEQGIACPAAITTDFAVCRAFLDEHAPKASSSKREREAPASNGRQPQASTGRNRDGTDRPPVRRSTDVAVAGSGRPARSRATASKRAARPSRRTP